MANKGGGADLPETIEKRCRKRLAAERRKTHSLFFGLGMFGVVGWSIAVPAVLGTLIGRWLDARGLESGQVSWTLTGLVVGLAAGCVVAWRWMNREGRVPAEDEE